MAKSEWSQFARSDVQKPGSIRYAVPELRNPYHSQVTSLENKQASEADGAIDILIPLLLRRENAVERNAPSRHVQ